VSGAFVADASVAIAWVHPGQATEDTDRALDAIAEGAQLDVPAIWPLEVANALTVLTRRDKLTERECAQALGWLRALRVRVDPDTASNAFTALPELAKRYGLSVYDAAYLELAARKKLRLCCKDGPLRKAAAKHGVALWR
jgi:predicted nucleic acid-binding protein